MPKFMFRASLSPEGVAGLLKEGGTARHGVVQDAVKALGGTLEAFYFAFGDDDVVGIMELPDNETAAGFALETSSSGRVSVSTTVLITPEEMDRAREKHSGWRAPGA
jgi:uncharacterized protein with GYD domain